MSEGFAGKVIIDTKVLDAYMKSMSPANASVPVAKAAVRILTDARINAPRDPNRPPQHPEVQVTGALKANSDIVKMDVSGLTQRIEFYQVYAAAQEFGRPEINLPARPYLTPAAEKAAKKFAEDLKEMLNK